MTYINTDSKNIQIISRQFLSKIEKGVLFKGSGNCRTARIAEVFPREAYLIFNGKIIEAISPGKFYISLLDFLNKITGISKKFMMYGGGFGGCGKYNQWPLEVGSGGPYIKMDKIYCDFRKQREKNDGD